MNWKRIFCTLVLALFVFVLAGYVSAQAQARVKLRDLKPMVGNWKGQLTYLDYTSGQPYTMPADLRIERLRGERAFIQHNIYPDEPHANDSDTLWLSDDGRTWDGDPVSSREKVAAGGTLKVITTARGEDGNDHRPATFRHTLILNDQHLERRKEVKFDGTDQWVLRHTYSFQRDIPLKLRSKKEPMPSISPPK